MVDAGSRRPGRRPHGSLGHLTTTEFAQRRQAMSRQRAQSGIVGFPWPATACQYVSYHTDAERPVGRSSPRAPRIPHRSPDGVDRPMQVEGGTFAPVALRAVSREGFEGTGSYDLGQYGKATDKLVQHCREPNKRPPGRSDLTTIAWEVHPSAHPSAGAEQLQLHIAGFEPGPALTAAYAEDGNDVGNSGSSARRPSRAGFAANCPTLHTRNETAAGEGPFQWTENLTAPSDFPVPCCRLVRPSRCARVWPRSLRYRTAG